MMKLFFILIHLLYSQAAYINLFSINNTKVIPSDANSQTLLSETKNVLFNNTSISSFNSNLTSQILTSPKYLSHHYIIFFKETIPQKQRWDHLSIIEKLHSQSIAELSSNDAFFKLAAHSSSPKGGILETYDIGDKQIDGYHGFFLPIVGNEIENSGVIGLFMNDNAIVLDSEPNFYSTEPQSCSLASKFSNSTFDRSINKRNDDDDDDDLIFQFDQDEPSSSINVITSSLSYGFPIATSSSSVSSTNTPGSLKGIMKKNEEDYPISEKRVSFSKAKNIIPDESIDYGDDGEPEADLDLNDFDYNDFISNPDSETDNSNKEKDDFLPKIYMIDSGIDENAYDLKENLNKEKFKYDKTSEKLTNSHGTKIASLIVQSDYQADIVDVNVGVDRFVGTYESIIEGIYWSIGHHERQVKRFKDYPGSILLMAFNPKSSKYDPLLLKAIDAAIKANMIVVMPAGDGHINIDNEPETLFYPVNSTNAPIIIGAQKYKQIASFSNYGDSVTLTIGYEYDFEVATIGSLKLDKIVKGTAYTAGLFTGYLSYILSKKNSYAPDKDLPAFKVKEALMKISNPYYNCETDSQFRSLDVHHLSELSEIFYGHFD